MPLLARARSTLPSSLPPSLPSNLPITPPSSPKAIPTPPPRTCEPSNTPPTPALPLRAPRNLQACPSVLLLDNYDSYTYNLVQLIGTISRTPPLTIRNDQYASWEQLHANLPSSIRAVVISPGPGDPTRRADFGLCGEVIERCGLPVLGVCLGHQGIAASFGASVVKAPREMHGRVSSVHHDGSGIFSNLSSPFRAVRYHSLCVERANLPSCLRVTASSDDGCIMAIAHNELPLHGVQFHPESICTELGELLLRNFLALASGLSPVPRTAALREPPNALVKEADNAVFREDAASAWEPHVAPGSEARDVLAREGASAYAGEASAASERVAAGSPRPSQLSSVSSRCLLVHSLDVECVGGSSAAAPRVFAQLYGTAAVSFWLDSSDTKPTREGAADGAGRSSRFSYMGCVEGQSSWLLRCTSDGKLWRTSSDGREVAIAGDMLTEMRRSLLRWRGAKPRRWGASLDVGNRDMVLPEACAFRCGLVGFFAYEAWQYMGPAATAAELAPVRARHLARSEETAGEGAGSEASAFIFADRLVAFDHECNKLFLICLHEQELAETCHDWLRKTTSLLAPLLSAEAACPPPCEAPQYTSPLCKPPSYGRQAHIEALNQSARSRQDKRYTSVENQEVQGVASFSSARSEDQYLRDIATIHELLRAGESYEICVTTSFGCKRVVPPLALHQTLRSLNPAPYGAFFRLDRHGLADRQELHDTANLDHDDLPLHSANTERTGLPAVERVKGSRHLAEGGFAICCSSPERFLRVTAEGTIESKPIKGTSPRGVTMAIDKILAQELASSEKDRAENLMITDLIRNDLGRVCAQGSVHVPSLMAVESYATVHQLVTTIRGKLDDGFDALDATAAAFPPGSMTGAPKIRTMRLIDEIEQSVPRGVYSGCLGFFSAHGAADLNVVIRTAVVSEECVRVSAGGAVVTMSEARSEWNEVLLKARAQMRAVAACLVDDPDSFSIHQDTSCESQGVGHSRAFNCS